jgi:hypothetical protein
MTCDDELGDTVSNGDTASDADASYESGWHDGVDYGYRLAVREVTCPTCGGSMSDAQ